YGFDPIFPPEVEAEAEGIPAEISAAEISKRKDMREVPTFTIDPIDAKDFDDALSIRTLENGRYEVGVHIADVSHYVRPGTDIDREAFQRGTSVYLVDRTVPMLPEKLSNEVCSLRPEEEKLTYSAIFELDEEAKIHKQWFGRTVIYSDYRFHYGEAEEVLKGEKDHQFREQLLTLNRLAYKLREKRFATGSIDFDTDEVKFVLDDQDKPIGVTKKARGDSNRLIEDFMLLANRKVAEFISNKEQGSPLPFVYRVHDRPDPDKLTNLQEFVKAFGYKVDFSDEKHTSHVMKQLLEKVDGRPEENVIENIAIRSMAKAVYTTKNVGHYGLGFAHYTHFTSPIRRYPDLLVHRLMEKYLHGTYDQNPVILEEQLKHSSNRERIAVEAERTSIKYKQVEYLSDKIGEEFEGVISGVIEKGVFVELVETLCEGLVPVFTIEGDYFFYDEDNYCMRGRETGMVLQLGDPVIVKITGTDMGKRTIDMELVKKLEPVGEVLK
ncbi:MAG: ribonuclease R, partial [Bacteroidota bacterium]